MKYALISIFAVLLAVGLSVLIVLLIARKHKMKGWLKAIIIPVSSVAISISFVLIYFAINYPATEDARHYLVSDETVDLEVNQDWYRFDNKENDDTAIIFYSGAKVDPVAYAPLCSEIAHEGIDVYIIKMPLYFPLLNMNAADKVASLNKHQHLYMMGHSLGGTTASMYLSKADHASYSGIIFLASYPNKKLDDSYRCLSIYGTNDLVLNKDEYNGNIANFPSGYQEVIIEGGNHGNYGDYGFQRGDGEASISKQEQWNITRSAVMSFINGSEA